jgi:hypothetical protein
VEPPLADHGQGHVAACHFAGTPIPEPFSHERLTA